MSKEVYPFIYTDSDDGCVYTYKFLLEPTEFLAKSEKWIDKRDDVLNEINLGKDYPNAEKKLFVEFLKAEGCNNFYKKKQIYINVFKTNLNFLDKLKAVFNKQSKRALVLVNDGLEKNFDHYTNWKNGVKDGDEVKYSYDFKNITQWKNGLKHGTKVKMKIRRNETDLVYKTQWHSGKKDGLEQRFWCHSPRSEKNLYETIEWKSGKKHGFSKNLLKDGEVIRWTYYQNNEERASGSDDNSYKNFVASLKIKDSQQRLGFELD